MTKLPEEVIRAWEDREGPIILTTVNNEGVPDAIYASCVSMYDDEILIVADNYFNKTKENILNECKAAVLFMNKDQESFQIKGDIGYFIEGKYYEDMKGWNPSRHPGHAAAVISIKKVFSGSKQLAGEE